jgi:prophage antirepressor-like protein
MEVVKAFTENELHTEIVIKGTMESPIFRASDVGEVLEMGNIRTTIQHFDDTEKVVHSMDTLGGIQNITFLTEKGLYKVLFKSRKPIAEKFQNWVCNVIKEIRLSGTYVLQQQLERANQEIQGMEEKNKQEWEKNKALEREKILRRDYATNGPLIYIIRVKSFDNGQYIIKIGESSKGIEARYNEHKTKYPECLLLDCFSVAKSRNFEKFLHNHETIRKNIVKNLPDHEKENELFLIGKDLTYTMVTRIIESNLQRFNEYSPNDFKQTIEETIQTMNLSNTHIPDTNITDILQKVLQNQQIILDKINLLEKKINTPTTKTTTNFNEPLATLGPRLQKINPENLTLVHTYESVTECMEESNFTIKRPSLNKAIKENTIYQNYRWVYNNRDKDPNIVENIQPTKKTRPQNIGYIAKLNEKKTEILNVYLDRKTTANLNGYQSCSSLDNPVKNGTITNNHYYSLFEKCDENLQDEFIQKWGEPLLYKEGVGMFDSSNNLVEEFTSKYDCKQQGIIGEKSLEKALSKGIMYNNHYYRKLGSKLVWLSD